MHCNCGVTSLMTIIGLSDKNNNKKCNLTCFCTFLLGTLFFLSHPVTADINILFTFPLFLVFVFSSSVYCYSLPFLVSTLPSCVLLSSFFAFLLIFRYQPPPPWRFWKGATIPLIPLFLLPSISCHSITLSSTSAQLHK